MGKFIGLTEMRCIVRILQQSIQRLATELHLAVLMPCSALKGETVPDSLPATPKSPPTRREK